MLKAAVIGVGSMGRNHARVYRELPDVKLVAVSDVHEPTAQKVAHDLHVDYVTDYKQLFEQYQPDLVSVSVPTAEHYEVVLEAIQRGIHVLVEKPIAATVDEAKLLIAAAKEHKVKLTVGHIERFNPALDELKKRLDSGAIGDVFRVQSRRMGPFPARIRDVGVVVDLASHDVDIVRYILDTDIVRVFAETASNIATDREDMMDAVLRCSNGVIGTLNINWVTPTKIRELTITGTQGMFLVNYLTQELYFYENADATDQWQSLSILKGVSEGTLIRPNIQRQEPLRRELESFVEAVQNEHDPLVSGLDGMKALQIAQAIVRSGLEQQIITIEN